MLRKSNPILEPEHRARPVAPKRRSGGQVLVMLTIFIPILLGVVAMSVDISVFDWNWSRMQAAADCAVLAGAASLPDSPSLAIAAATTYAESNGMTASEITTPTVALNNPSIAITLSRVVPYYFGRVLGLVNSPVVTKSTANLLNTGSASGALPIGLSIQTTYSFGQSITLHQGGVGPSNWDGLALGCTGGACYANNPADGFSGTVSVGDALLSEPGAKVGPADSGINACISAGQSADPGGTWSDHTLTDPRVGIVPVVDWTGCNGRCSVPVEGFAAVWITA